MEGINKLSVKTYQMNGFKKCFLTLNLNDIATFEHVCELYEVLVGYIAEKHIKVVYEKVFGQLAYKEEFKALRNEKIKAPLTFLEGMSVMDTPFSSILICGIIEESDEVSLRYIKTFNQEELIGTEICSPSFQYLYLAEIKSWSKDFNDMYQELEKYLDVCGYEPFNIVRTWIYINQIDDNYLQFNQARREFFERNEIDFDSKAKRLPASTCISGKAEESCYGMIDVQCIKNENEQCKIERVYNILQNEAEGKKYLYGPTFSRGMLTEADNCQEVHVSGTASINEAGKTVYVGDEYGQIKKTLLNVNSILQQYDMTFSDLCQSTCFFKKKEYYAEFLKCLEELGLEKFSDTFVVADVCRSDLLFELDGIAIKEI